MDLAPWAWVPRAWVVTVAWAICKCLKQANSINSGFPNKALRNQGCYSRQWDNSSSKYMTLEAALLPMAVSRTLTTLAARCPRLAHLLRLHKIRKIRNHHHHHHLRNRHHPPQARCHLRHLRTIGEAMMQRGQVELPAQWLLMSLELAWTNCDGSTRQWRFHLKSGHGVCRTWRYSSRVVARCDQSLPRGERS